MEINVIIKMHFDDWRTDREIQEFLNKMYGASVLDWFEIQDDKEQETYNESGTRIT